MSGVRSINLSTAATVDDLIGNRSGSTVRISLLQLLALLTGLQGPTHATLAGLMADLDWPAGAQGYVTGDATPANNGRYRKDGAAGSGGWTRVGELLASGPSAAELAQKAPLASPVLTGAPTAPTPAIATLTDQIATARFVHDVAAAKIATALEDLLAGAPGALNTLNELAAALGDDANFSATVTTALAQKAPLASPVLTGTPTAPTPVIATLTNQVATARFVHDVSAAKVAALDATVDPRAAFLASLWRFSGEYEDGLPAQPATVAEDGRVLTWALATPVDPGVAFAAALWQFTGDYAAGDDVPSIVTEDGRILLSGQWPVGATAGAVGGLVRAIIDTGQSNAEGRSGDATSVVYGAGAVSSLLTLQRGTEADTWQGQATGGGDSIELDGATITALGPLAPQIAGTGTHGTCASEGCARALMRDGGAFAVWSDAEGGQYIGNLMPDAPPGYFAFANAVTKLSRAAALLPAGARLEVGWLLMAQGESDTGRADLGAEHDALRADYSSAAQAALGLAGAVRMISTQPSSFGEETGALSILSQALDVADAGLFFCGGPTYGFPWSSDYLHHASLGHAMRGELCAAIIRRVESEGAYLPLHMQAASVTGPAEITVTMSEPVVLDADDANVAAVANAGISLTGGTPAGVTVSGDRIIITTTGSAAAVTAVGIALSGHSGTRTPATIPRSIIRARRGLGVYSFGGPIKAWACHQQIQIS